MKLGGNQPYFLPYIGYFQLIKTVDLYVIADNLQYIKQGWINRNHLLLNGQSYLFNLSVLGASPNKMINEITVADDHRKLLKTIEISYRRAPFFSAVFPLLENIFHYEDKNLARFNGNGLMQIADYLHFDTKFTYLSDVNRDTTLKAQNMALNLCSVLGATEYINAIGGTVLYDKEMFKNNGIDLFFLKTRPIEYKQFNNTFVPNLSILDVLMFNSIEQTNELLLQFDLV